MEQRFKTSGQDIDLLPLREFIERKGEEVAYRRGDQTRWFAYVTEGCFKYITYGLSERLRGRRPQVGNRPGTHHVLTRISNPMTGENDKMIHLRPLFASLTQ